MGRLINLALILAMAGGAALTYQTKHAAVEAARDVADLRHAIEQERISISMLKAEWSVLNQPDRLQALVTRYAPVLDLAPFDLGQMVRIEDIPLKEPAAPTEAQAAADGIGAAIGGR